MRIGHIVLILIVVQASFARENLRKLYNKVEPSSVEILVDGSHGGSGNFVSSDGLVLSASHIFVATGMDGDIEVLSKRFGRMPATLVELDRAHDLALVQIEAGHEDGYPYLKVASRNPAVGEELYSVSAPLHIHHSFNKAFVSSDRLMYRKTGCCNGYIAANYIVALSPRGSSGGCWVDADGEIVGVQSGWVDSLGGGNRNSGFNFIPPPAPIARFVETREAPSLAWIGGTLEELWTQSRGFVDRFPKGAEGLVIHAMAKDGPLMKAGLKRESLITHADGEPLRYKYDFLDSVRRKSPGDKIGLRILLPDGGGVEEKQIVLGQVNTGKGKRRK